MDPEMSTAVPDKSLSLRQSSVQRRLEVERSRREPKQRKKLQKMTLSKYRRKCANAKVIVRLITSPYVKLILTSSKAAL
jgi:hypothetical protein